MEEMQGLEEKGLSRITEMELHQFHFIFHKHRFVIQPFISRVYAVKDVNTSMFFISDSRRKISFILDNKALGTFQFCQIFLVTSQTTVLLSYCKSVVARLDFSRKLSIAALGNTGARCKNIW